MPDTFESLRAVYDRLTKKVEQKEEEKKKLDRAIATLHYQQRVINAKLVAIQLPEALK